MVADREDGERGLTGSGRILYPENGTRPLSGTESSIDRGFFPGNNLARRLHKQELSRNKESDMRKTAIFILTIFLALPLAAGQDEALEPEQNYTNRSFARLNFITGDTFIQKASDLAYEEGEVNMPIVEGDRVGTTDGRAEIYLGLGAYLRLDHQTKLDVLTLPNQENDLTRIQLWSGSAILSLNRLDREKSIEIHTSDMSIYLLAQGLYRIDVRENAQTELFVFDGMAETAGQDESHMVKDAQRVEAVRGRFIDPPLGFTASEEDSFDRWSDYRESGVRGMLAERHLPEELEDYEGELEEAGDWSYDPAYGDVWVPRGLSPDWRPYWNGRWIWNSIAGWTWLPYESWGWATFHFGRWHWGASLGWHWIPTRRWGPAWVSWYSWGDYLGWAPMSYYGYPGVIINNIYHPRYTGTYHPYDSRTLTVIHKRQIHARNTSKAALDRTRINSLGRLAQTKTAPMGRPQSARAAVQQLGDRRVFLHNTDKAAPYRKPGSAPAAKVRGQESQQNSVPARRPAASVRSSINRVGYPSSPNITGGTRSKSGSTLRGTRSPVSRFYDSINERGSRVTRRTISGVTPTNPGSRSGVRSGGVKVTRPPTMRSPARTKTSRAKTSTGSRTAAKSRSSSSRKRSSGTKTKKK